MLYATITDPGFATNISDLKDFVTGPVGTGIFGIAVAAVVLMFALRWFKKASNQGK